MKYRLFALFVPALLVMSYVVARISEQPADRDSTGFHNKHEVVRLFIDAVKRGELVVLGQQISHDMLMPIKVIYTYELNKAIPEISIYSVINPPLDPGIPEAELHAVSVSIHPDGSILDIRSHVWPKTEK